MVANTASIVGAVVLGAIVFLGVCFMLPQRWRPVLLVPLAFYLVWQFTAWPMTDSGSTDVRKAAVQLLAADAAVGQWPADMKARERDFKTGADERRAALAKVWAPAVLDQHVKEWEDALAEFYDDADYDPYDKNRYVVTDWRSARQKVDRAVVVFRGHMEYKDSKTGDWVGSAPGTEHLTMRRLDGSWRLVSESVTDYNPS